MATTKRRASRSSTSSPSTESSGRPPKDGTGNFKSYARMRAVLDAMEIAALRRYMEAETASERDEWAAEVEGLIMPVINRLRAGLAEECPRGFNNCGGCCVPYRCPREIL